ncbi:hypothetical protein ACROYT_G008282 [Oculina patagonica]
MENTGSQENTIMSESGEASGPPIQQEIDQESASDSEDDSDTDFDPEEIEKEIMGVRSMLRRQCARHKNVAKLKSEHEHWLADEITLRKNPLNLEGSDIKETINLVNKAEDRERTRRMSIPFSADVEETELDISVQSGQLSTVHQELLHLFAIHDANFQMDCERDRRTVETTKNQMHEELLRNMARRKAREEFELERERKIKEMQMLTEAMSEEGIAMAETNDRLSHVHEDLKNAFKMMRDAKAAEEENQRERTEDLKEMMLQEIRRRPLKNEKDITEQERLRREKLYEEHMNELRGSTDALIEVQEQLLKIFSKLKREKKVKKIETKQQQEDNKVRMQEELVRKSLQKEVSIQEAHEKARRIMESKSEIADGDEAKTKAIDMLIDVQKQLLDVFAISKAQDVKQRMNHLKLMNCRKNMLREIRSRRVDRENSSGFM